MKSLFGVYVPFQTQAIKDFMLNEDKGEYDEKVEVRCVIDGETRDFTLEEFKAKLGFKI